MDEFDANAIRSGLREVKNLTINVSRGLDALAGKRSGKKLERRPGDLVLKNAVSELVGPMTTAAGGRVTYERGADEVARQLYPHDHSLHDYLQRAAVNPASTTTVGNAQELVPTNAVIDFLTADAPSGFVHWRSNA